MAYVGQYIHTCETNVFTPLGYPPNFTSEADIELQDSPGIFWGKFRREGSVEFTELQVPTHPP